MAKSKCRLPDLLQGEGGGRTSLFFQRFELCATLNKWESNEDKIGQLYPLLADKVFLFLTSISADKRDTYDKVKKLIVDEYEDTELEETYAEQFTQRRMRPGEDLSMLMADLKTMVKRGYPSFSAADRAKLVYNQFMRSVSPAVRQHILLHVPKVENANFSMATCDDLLETARKVEQVQRIPGDQSKSIPKQTVASVSEPTDDNFSKVMSALEAMTDKMTEALTIAAVSNSPSPVSHRGSRNSQGSGGYNRGGNRDRFPGECYKCGNYGHRARECKRLPTICSVCGNTGHRDSDCALRRKQGALCGLCGNTGHKASDCAMRYRKLN